jgi:hypothetical protein
MREGIDSLSFLSPTTKVGSGSFMAYRARSFRIIDHLLSNDIKIAQFLKQRAVIGKT